MQVQCLFIDKRGTLTDDELIQRHTNARTAFQSNFVNEIQAVLQGNAVWLDNLEMVVIGGRKSICNAFAQIPVANYEFRAPQGKLIYVSHTRSSKGKGYALGLGALRITQMATSPIYNGITTLKTGGGMETFSSRMKNTYDAEFNRLLFGVLGLASKTRTILHLFSESSDFDGTPIASAPTGAQLSLLLRKYFGV